MPIFRYLLQYLFFFGVFLSGCSGLSGRKVEPMLPAAMEFTFEQNEVVIGSAKRQTVLTGFLLGGTIAELAVVNIDENNDRRLRIYAFGDGTWAPVLDATLRSEVLFVDVANIGGRDRLITYGSGRLNWFDPESATEHALMEITSNFNPPPRDQISHIDVTRDVNGDERDDLVVPDVNGFWVFIQMSDGAFADPVKIGPSIEMRRIYGDNGYRYNPWAQGRVHEMDYNQDGRRDLVFWKEDHFEVHLQDEHGLFASVPVVFTTDVLFNSDDLGSLVAPEGVRSRRKDHAANGNMTGRVLHSLTDMNGDSVADLVIFSLESGSNRFLGQTSELWSMHSTYEVHFGTLMPDRTLFAPNVGAAIHSDGIPFGLEPRDFDHDGQVDVMFTIINPGVFKVIGMLVSALLTQSVSMDLHFYRMEDAIYSDRPNVSRKIRTTSLGQSGEKAAAHFPLVLIGDVNGDRRSDLLVQQSQKSLCVFLGVPGPDLFSRRPQKVAVTMPNEEYVWLVDLNKDGKQDILLHHPSTTEPHRVTMLVAR